MQQRGDAAVLEYTSRFDALDGGVAGRSSSCTPGRTAGGASTALPAAQREALRGRGRARAQLPRAPEEGQRRELELPRRRRHAARPEGHAAGPRRHLRARRQGGLSVGGADERDPGPGGRRRRDHHGGADAARREEPAGAGRRRTSPASTASSPSAARRRSARWPTAPRPCRAVDKITGPGNAYVASAKRRVFGTVGIDMIAGPERDPGAGRRHARRPTGWRWTCSRQAEHDELAQSILLCPDAAYIDAGAGSDRPPAADDAARATIIAHVARRPRRADPDAQHGRGLRDQQPHRARAPGGRAAATRTAGSRCCATPARSSWAPSPARALGDYCAGPNHVLPTRGTARFSVAAGRVRLPEAQQPDRGERGRRRRRWARSPPNWPTAKACRRTRAPPSCGCDRTRTVEAMSRHAARAAHRSA